MSVLDQVRQESHLDVAEVDEKKAVDTETSIHDIKLPKKQGNVGEEVDVCISPMDSEKYISCRMQRINEGWPLSRNSSVCDRISNKMSNLKHGLIVSVHYGSFRSD